MRCFLCSTEVTDRNPYRDLPPNESEIVENYYGLIHLTGPLDMFDADGYVILCVPCITKALKEEQQPNGAA